MDPFVPPAPALPPPPPKRVPGPNPHAQQVSLYIRPVRRQVRDDFKAACAKRGECMRSVILQFVLRYIQNAEEHKLNITDNRKKKGKK